MRPAALCLILFGAGLLTAQQPQPNTSVRSISVKVIPTSSKGIALDYEAIRAAWKSKRVNLEVETRLDVASIERAEAVIRESYGSQGHAVRVEHSVNQIRPEGVEVAFQVVELCRCE
jgi:hypothetical protein